MFGAIAKGLKRDVKNQEADYVEEIFQFIEDPDAKLPSHMGAQQSLNYKVLHQLQNAMNKRINLPMDM